MTLRPLVHVYTAYLVIENRCILKQLLGRHPSLAKLVCDQTDKRVFRRILEKFLVGDYDHCLLAAREHDICPSEIVQEANLLGSYD